MSSLVDLEPLKQGKSSSKSAKVTSDLHCS